MNRVLLYGAASLVALVATLIVARTVAPLRLSWIGGGLLAALTFMALALQAVRWEPQPLRDAAKAGKVLALVTASGLLLLTAYALYALMNFST